MRKISEKAAILKMPLDCSSTSDIRKRPNHQFLLLLPKVMHFILITIAGGNENYIITQIGSV